MKKEAPENEASYFSHGLRAAVFLFVLVMLQCMSSVVGATVCTENLIRVDDEVTEPVCTESLIRID